MIIHPIPDPDEPGKLVLNSSNLIGCHHWLFLPDYPGVLRNTWGGAAMRLRVISATATIAQLRILSRGVEFLIGCPSGRKLVIILNPARRQPQHQLIPICSTNTIIVADNHDGPFKPPEIPSDNFLGFRSRWLVGSSRIRKLAFCSKILHSAIRAFSPGDRTSAFCDIWSS